jgi:tyrosyl-tRNA synthetase
MSIPDELIARWARLADFRSQAECDALESGLREGTRSPMDEKKTLARNIVTRYHGADAARDAQAFFESTVQRKEIPADVADLAIARAANSDHAEKLVDIIVTAKLADSKRAAQRLIEQGSVRIDGKVVEKSATRWPAGRVGVLQVGKKPHIRIHIKNPNES